MMIPCPKTLAVLAVMFLVATPIVGQSPGPPESGRPPQGAATDAAATNILLLLADDLGYETLGCYGSRDFQTPHLDRLASQGMRFSRAYTSPVCTPSRMSLYTGTYVSRHGYDDVLPVHLGTRQAVDFRSGFTTLAQVLRQGGYRTSVTGKWQLAALEFHPQHCRDAGFDSWCVWQIWRDGGKTTRYWNPCFNHDGMIRPDIAERFGPDVLADYVIDQMESAVAAGRPFYIHHNMLLPHLPIVATPDQRRSGQPGSLEHMIGYMDSLCGRIIQAVDRLGIADQTCVIFMGDNGTDTRRKRQTDAGTVVGGKRDLNDAGTHIPLIVRHPGRIAAGAVVDDLVEMSDWFPTLCDYVNVPLPADLALDGVSFASRLENGPPPNRRWVSGGIHGDISLFDGQWRFDVRSQRVIDARHLPQETLLSEESARTAAGLQRLRDAAAEMQPKR
ncbi:sulfatase-like hydrolase/transferase [Stieleria sp. TO1_6]|uniref:sulfatase-like hydrolase/transferase n=1 Tax=Stieleria tagensis TaxID=2956795 RepID=UPI00209B15CD|nr:sulfatase-like hydrolase/transferase [Stieleria tagensis]MCO8121716.1 sulfatase-like hydrolase/transferase [Stieleria tagensis]